MTTFPQSQDFTLPGTDSVVLGLDIGGTKLAAAVVDGDGHVRSFVRTPTRPSRGWRPVMDDLVAAGHAAMQDAGVSATDLSAVGVGCGGPLDTASGIVLSPPNLPGWDAVPVVAALEVEFGRPTYLENDANAAAIATSMWGPWAGTQDLVYLTVSTGVGAGVLSGGRLLRGAGGNGAEVGHVVVCYGGRLCGCGQRGCLEAYVSGQSIARRAREALGAGAESQLGELAWVTAADVCAAARDGDAMAVRLWDETTGILGAAVASVLNLFEPRLVVLGGGVTQAGAMLIDPVRTDSVAQALSPAGRQADVVLTSFGDTIGVVGAAAVAAARLAMAGVAR